MKTISIKDIEGIRIGNAPKFLQVEQDVLLF